MLMKSSKEHDTALTAAAAGGVVGVLIGSSVMKQKALKEVDGVAPLKAHDLKNMVYSQLKSWQTKQVLPSVLMPVEQPGNGLRYALHPYLLAVSYGNGELELLVGLVTFLLDDDDEIWRGQYVRHLSPNISKEVIKDQVTMEALLESGLNDALGIFVSDLKGEIDKKDDTEMIMDAPDSHIYYAGFGGWALNTPDEDIEAVDVRMPGFTVMGGIHLFSPDTISTRPLPVAENVKYMD